MLYNISVHRYLGKIHRKKVWMKLSILNIYALKSKGKKMEMIQ